MMKNKKVLYGLVVGAVLLGGVGTFAVLNQPKQPTVATSETITSSVVVSSQGSTTVNVAVSELSSKLNNEVTAETNVAELEQQLATITDEKVREELAKKLDDVKKQHAVKVEEKPKDEQPQSTTVVKADEVSQPVQSVPSTPQTTQRPAETTTRQTIQEMTSQVIGYVTAPPKRTASSSKTIVIGGMGNSGREFSTWEEAHAWAYKEQPKIQLGYSILPIVYSDDTQTYTIEWGE